MKSAEDDFYKDAKAPDGLYGWCRECSLAASRTKTTRTVTASGNYTYTDSRSAYRERRADRIEAKKIAKLALKDGAIAPQQPCEKCGDPASWMFHDDPAQPLEVRWLCKKHTYEMRMLDRKNERS